jgi:hypothetical protein
MSHGGRTAVSGGTFPFRSERGKVCKRSEAACPHKHKLSMRRGGGFPRQPHQVSINPWLEVEVQFLCLTNCSLLSNNSKQHQNVLICT